MQQIKTGKNQKWAALLIVVGINVVIWCKIEYAFFFQIGDFNVSLALMQVRVHQIARMVFRCDDFSNADILDNDDWEMTLSADQSNHYSIRSTLEAINYILEMYKNEVKQFKCVDHFKFSTLADIIITIHRILNLNDLSNLIR